MIPLAVETYELASAKLTADKAPGWIENGIMITGYSGTETTVTIPEKIDGKYVTGIASGAFVNCTEMQTLVLSRRIPASVLLLVQT